MAQWISGAFLQRRDPIRRFHRHAPDGGVYRGHAAWRSWLLGREEGLRELRFDISEVLDAPANTVVARVRVVGRGRASGIEVEAVAAGLWKLREGTITSLTLYQTWDDALNHAPGD